MVVLGLTLLLHQSLGTSALIISLSGGKFATFLLNKKYFQSNAVGEGAMRAVIAIANIAAVVGFGGVVKATLAFEAAVNVMTDIPGSPLIGGALAVAFIAGLTDHLQIHSIHFLKEDM